MTDCQIKIDHLGRPYREIFLTKGHIAWIDPDDFERVGDTPWCAQAKENGRVYARRKLRRSEYDSFFVANTHIYLHREILRVADRRILVDHKDGNTLDCRKHNLRLATSSQNNCNSRLRNDNTSGAKGIHWDNERHRWCVTIRFQGKFCFKKRFASLDEAIAARTKVIDQFHGEFARQDNVNISI